MIIDVDVLESKIKNIIEQKKADHRLSESKKQRSVKLLNLILVMKSRDLFASFSKVALYQPLIEKFTRSYATDGRNTVSFSYLLDQHPDLKKKYNEIILDDETVTTIALQKEKPIATKTEVLPHEGLESVTFYLQTLIANIQLEKSLVQAQELAAERQEFGYMHGLRYPSDKSSVRIETVENNYNELLQRKEKLMISEAVLDGFKKLESDTVRFLVNKARIPSLYATIGSATYEVASTRKSEADLRKPTDKNENEEFYRLHRIGMSVLDEIKSNIETKKDALKKEIDKKIDDSKQNTDRRYHYLYNKVLTTGEKKYTAEIQSVNEQLAGAERRAYLMRTSGSALEDQQKVAAQIAELKEKRNELEGKQEHTKAAIENTDVTWAKLKDPNFYIRKLKTKAAAPEIFKTAEVALFKDTSAATKQEELLLEDAPITAFFMYYVKKMVRTILFILGIFLVVAMGLSLVLAYINTTVNAILNSNDIPENVRMAIVIKYLEKEYPRLPIPAFYDGQMKQLLEFYTRVVLSVERTRFGGTLGAIPAIEKLYRMYVFLPLAYEIFKFAVISTIGETFADPFFYALEWLWFYIALYVLLGLLIRTLSVITENTEGIVSRVAYSVNVVLDKFIYVELLRWISNAFMAFFIVRFVACGSVNLTRFMGLGYFTDLVIGVFVDAPKATCNRVQSYTPDSKGEIADQSLDFEDALNNYCTTFDPAVSSCTVRKPLERQHVIRFGNQKDSVIHFNGKCEPAGLVPFICKAGKITSKIVSPLF